MRERLIRQSERFAAWLAYLPPAFRIGRGYSSTARSISRFACRPAEEQERETFSRLTRLLNYAYDKVPFYAELYRRHNFSPRDVESIRDWERVPVVTKADLGAVPLADRCARGKSGRAANTGGTSGAPLGFQLESRSAPFEWAHMHAIWYSHGYRVQHTKLRLGGTYFEGSDPIRFHPRHNEYVANSNASMSAIVDAVIALPVSRAIRWIHGYPSLVAEFAHELDTRQQAVGAGFRASLLGVLLGSEFPAELYREPIQQILSANVVSWYGHSEMAVLARETAKGIYHSLPTYGYAEAVLLDGEAEARLVSTSLHNWVHPFIRYDTGDRILPLATHGSSLSFSITEGRIGDFVLDRQGRRLALTSIIFGRHHPAFDRLSHLQVRQTEPGEVTLLVVPRGGHADESELRSGFDFSGIDLAWNVELIPEPRRTRSGKIRLKVET